MAARNTTHMAGTLQRGLVKLFLKSVGNTTSNMTTTYGLGMSTTITRNSAGTYGITLRDKYAALIHASFNVIDAGTVDDWTINVVSEAVASTKIIVITVFKDGTAADLPATATLTGEITLSNTSIIPVKG